MIVFGIMTLGDLCFGGQETPVHILSILSLGATFFVKPTSEGGVP